LAVPVLAASTGHTVLIIRGKCFGYKCKLGPFAGCPCETFNLKRLQILAAACHMISFCPLLGPHPPPLKKLQAVDAVNVNEPAYFFLSLSFLWQPDRQEQSASHL
jgi:hypothetical protein